MNSRIDEILQQKMDRKQFFKHVGAGLTAFVGLGMITRALQPPQDQQKVTRGYGASVYGGIKQPSAARAQR